MSQKSTDENPELSPEKNLVVETVNRAVNQIIEHVDSVQIIVTFHDGENTSSYDKGAGNFYARQGSVEEWITMQRQYQKNHAIRRDSE